MSTFTITTYDSAIASVTLTAVPDPTVLDKFRVYVSSVVLNSSLGGSQYQLTIAQPTGITGYSGSGAATVVPIYPYSSPVTFASSSSSNSTDGTYTYPLPVINGSATNWTPTGSVYIGMLTGWNGSTVGPNPKFVLQANTGSGYANVSEVPTATYTFEITQTGSDRNRTVNTLFVGFGDFHLNNNAPTLYYSTTYNTTHSSAQLTSGVSSVTIGSDNYIAYLDPGSYVTGGNDFTLYVPQFVNTDGGTNGYVESEPTASVGTFNLMNLGLQPTIPTMTQGASATSDAMERYTKLILYAYFPLSTSSTFVVDSVVKATAPNAPVQVSTYSGTVQLYQSFTYQNYTFSLQLGGTNPNNYISMEVSNGSATPVGPITLNAINLKIVPITGTTIQSGSFAVPPP